MNKNIIGKAGKTYIDRDGKGLSIILNKNKTELEKYIDSVKLRVKMWRNNVLVDTGNIAKAESDIKELETQLAELNKAKTGRVKIGDDLSEVDTVYIVLAFGEVIEADSTLYNKDAVKQGKVFYDKPSAELFALREATEYKIWCEFGDDVVILPTDVYPRFRHKNVRYLLGVPDEAHTRINNFLDTLSEDELNSIRSE